MPSSSAPTGSTPGGSFTPQQRQEIVDIIRSALKSDPSILRDAVGALQQDEAAQQDAAESALVAHLGPALTRKPGDPVAGNPNGDVTVVEFYDVRCPYCRAMLPVMASLLAQDHNLRVVFKDIPILGPGSVIGAKAVLAAQRQGGYLKLHDALMTGPAAIDGGVVRAAAQRAGLDVDQLERDRADPAIQARIDANLAMAQQLSIQGTPTYVIGTHMFSGALQLAEMEKAVTAARR
jgi:protein-disulfide isomerase